MTYSGRHKDNCDGKVFGKGKGKRGNGSEPSACNICDLKADNRYDLMDHIQKCHELEEKHCWRCDFQTKDVLCLRKHFDEKHKRFKGLKTCPHCESSFKTWDHRRVHIDSQHNGIRYPCGQCDFKAKQRVHLRIHVENVHLKLRFYCDECPYNSGQKSHLSTHKKVVHQGFIVRCDKCDYTTGYAFELKKHVRRRHSGLTKIKNTKKTKVKSEKPPTIRKEKKEKIPKEKKPKKLRKILEKKKRKEIKDMSSPKPTQKEKALQRLKKHYGVKNHQSEKAKASKMNQEELEAYVRNVAASFKTPLLPSIETLATKETISPGGGMGEDNTREDNPLKQDFPMRTKPSSTLSSFKNSTEESKWGRKETIPINHLNQNLQVLDPFEKVLDPFEKVVDSFEKVLDPFEKVDKMKEINEHLSIFASASLVSVKSKQGLTSVNKTEDQKLISAKKLEVFKEETENPIKKTSAPTVFAEETYLTKDKLPKVESGTSLAEENLIDSIVPPESNQEEAIQAKTQRNIIDSIIDDVEESDLNTGEVEKADEVEKSSFEKIGDSDLDDKMGESESEAEDKISKSEPSMKAGLVDKISETWEDIVVRRVAKQMQMK